MRRRPKHPDKDIEDELRVAEAHNFRVTKGSRYFKVLCPCGNHQRGVALTPSGSRYLANLQAWLRRCPMWKEGQ